MPKIAYFSIEIALDPNISTCMLRNKACRPPKMPSPPLDGKDMIRRVFETAARLKDDMKVVYLENYDMNLAKFLVAGADWWLYTNEYFLEKLTHTPGEPKPALA